MARFALFSEAEKRFNRRLTEGLEGPRFRVFLLQRDGVEKGKPPYDKMAPEGRRHALFHLDCSKTLEADVFLFVLDGRVPDEGACVELGIAFCQKELQRPDKLLVGLRTDSRAAFLGSGLNPRVGVPLAHVAGSEGELSEELAEHKVGRIGTGEARGGRDERA